MRCAVQRLTLEVQAQALRESLTWRHALSSTPARSALAAALVLLVSRKHAGRVAGWISAALGLLRLARTVRDFAARPGGKAP